jgi:hypothetical protein
MSPNEPAAHFCAKCGAPLSSYAATGPFESIFAEAHVYRSAAERPRNLVVVIGMWLIFGPVGLSGGVMVLMAGDIGAVYALAGALLLAISVALVWKTTRNYLARNQPSEKPDAQSGQD